MQLTTLKAQARPEADSRATKRLRKQGKVPGVLYGLGQESVSVSVDSSDLRQVFGPGKRYTLLDLEIDGKAGNPALIYDYQKDALSQEITHLDFIRIAEDKPVQVKIPVHLEGVPVGVKTEGGQLRVENKFVKVKSCPTTIPTEIKVDVTEFHAQTTYYARQLELGEGIVLSSVPQTVVFTVTKGRGK